MARAGGKNPFVVERFTFQTRYRPTACATFLQAAVQRSNDELMAQWRARHKPWEFLLGRFPSERFLYGEADERGFWLKNSLQLNALEARGQLEVQADGTRISLRLALSPLARYLTLAFWAVLLLPMGSVFVLLPLRAGAVRAAGIGALAVVIVFTVFAGLLWLFYLHGRDRMGDDRGRLLAFIQQTLETTEDTPTC